MKMLRMIFRYQSSSALFALTMLLAAPASQAAMPKIGTAAPDFVLKSSSGKNLKLSEHRGEVVMINFWATWCGRAGKSCRC